LFERYHAALVAEGKKGVDGIRWYWERYVGELPDEPRKKHARERLKAPGGVNWQNRLVAKITKAEISRLRFELAEKVGHTTANRVLQLLSAMFNFGRREDLFQGENPVHGLRKFKTNSRERFLQSDEAYKFFEALDAYPDNDFQDYVRLSILTGARRGNVLRMRWDELNLEGSRWTLSGEFTKNGDPLTIPLVGDAVEILRRRQEMAKGYWVFPGGTAEGHAGAFRCAWKRLLENAGLKDFRIHDLRRTMGAWLVGSGASTTVAMRALGHKSVQAAMIYQRLHLDPVRAAMENAVAALHSAVANGKAEAEKQVNDEGTRPQKTESSKRKAPVVEICKASAAAAD
jgi:integrase